MNKTCKDCIHCDVCKKRHFPSMFGLTGDGCDDFKDKSRFIELPCAVGDVVYAIGNTDRHHQIKECRVSDFGFESAENFCATVWFECDQDCEGCYFNDWSQSYCGEWSCSGEYGNGIIHIKDFGKTVFLTKEDAEKVLKGGDVK